MYLLLYATLSILIGAIGHCGGLDNFGNGITVMSFKQCGLVIVSFFVE